MNFGAELLHRHLFSVEEYESCVEWRNYARVWMRSNSVQICGTFETLHSLFEKIQRSYSLHIDILDTTQTTCSK